MEILKKVTGARDKTLSPVDMVFRVVCVVCALALVVLAVAIFLELIAQSWESIKTFGFGFVVSDDWNPVIKKFGAASSIYGTLVTTIIAMIIAVPLGFAIALFLSELAHPAVAKFIGVSIEMLARGTQYYIRYVGVICVRSFYVGVYPAILKTIFRFFTNI